MDVNRTYEVIGVMAGSSMDGLDLAHVSLKRSTAEKWSYTINKCQTIPYPQAIYNELMCALKLDLEGQKDVDVRLGKWIGESINDFINPNEQIDLLGVHGHTLIHEPKNGISWQLGDGSRIAQITGIPTVTQFRTQDVKLGGQGAPLVPLGDFLLFGEYDACLNLGGIANISIKRTQTAWDICPCNQVLNYFSNKLGKPYDDGGKMASQGQLNLSFFEELSSIPFFDQKPPKSLPNHFLEVELLNQIDPKDGLHTYACFVANQISKSLDGSIKRILVTGGGAHNRFLIDKLNNKVTHTDVFLPKTELIEFKEAIVFAFLALKRNLNEINVYASVTGAIKDSSSGVTHLPE